MRRALRGMALTEGLGISNDRVHAISSLVNHVMLNLAGSHAKIVQANTLQTQCA
jgi:hypothetical protein